MSNSFLDQNGLAHFKEKMDEQTNKLLANKANTDGYYGGMTVGSAENLVGRGSVDAEYAGIRTSAGTADIGSGSASITRMKGRSFKWNQLVRNGNFSVNSNWSVYDGTISISDNVLSLTGSEGTTRIVQTIPLINGHKYYVKVSYRSTLYIRLGIGANNSGTKSLQLNIINDGQWHTTAKVGTPDLTSYLQAYCRFPTTYSGDSVTVQIANFNAIDLTALGIDNLTTEEEVETWLAENIGPLDYYDYNEGEVINNKAQAIETVGFNLYDPSTGKAFLPGPYSDYPQEYEICGTFTSISFKDINGNESVPTLADGRFFNVDAPGELTVVGGNNTDTLVHLVCSGWRNFGEPDYAFEPYWKNTLNLNLTQLTGKLNGAGESVVVFPNGLAKIGNVQDEIMGNKAIKRVGVVDMGTLNFAYENGCFKVGGLPRKFGSYIFNILCALYVTYTQGHSTGSNIGTLSEGKNKMVFVNSGSATFYIKDSAYTDVDSFKSAMSGVLLYYELATPEEYILDEPLPSQYRVDDFGTERVIPSYSQSLTAPISYDVQYAMNAVDAIRRLPDNYVERSDVKQTPGQSEEFVLSQKAVDDNYAKKAGVENDLLVGAAKALAGNHQISGEITMSVMSGADGVAKINEVRGKSLVWNQLIDRLAKATDDWTLTYNDATKECICFNGTSASTALWFSGAAIRVAGHTWLNIFKAKCTLAGTYEYQIGLNPTGVISMNLTADYQTFAYIGRLGVYPNARINTKLPVGETLTIKDYMLFDLTLMFGAGNEPATVEEFEKMFPLPYYDYNAGEIISNKTEKVEVTGFNQWDEEWEVGNLSTIDGSEVKDNNNIRSDFMRAVPNATYYIKSPKSLRFWWYDGAKNALSYAVAANGRTQVAPANAVYFRFGTTGGYGNTYQNDICINLSDAARNGTYEPYKHAEIPMNLSTLTGKLNGEGESVVIYPDGMRSAGTAHDYLIVDADGYARKAVKVMESRAYADGDESDATVITDKTNTIYELATPLTYDLDEPIQMTFMAYHGGTLKQVPENTSTPTTTPLPVSITYALDAVSMLNDLPQNYISAESIDNFLAVLSTQMGGTWSRTFNATTGKHEFTFTPSSTSNALES